MSTHCKLTVILVGIYPHKTNFDPQTKPLVSQDNSDFKCNAIQIYLQAKSSKVYTGRLGGSGVGGSGVQQTERNILLITVKHLRLSDILWAHVIQTQGRKGCHDFSVISENFNYNVNIGQIYQTFNLNCLTVLLAPHPFSKLASSPEFPSKIELSHYSLNYSNSKPGLHTLLFLSFVSQMLIKSLFNFLRTYTPPNPLLCIKKNSSWLLKFSPSSVLPRLSVVKDQSPLPGMEK